MRTIEGKIVLDFGILSKVIGITELLLHKLEGFGAVLIEGPKWCGKTWSSERQAKSVFYLASPENNFANRMLARLAPEEVLDGDLPRLLDEWQEVPELWDAVGV